MSTVPVHISNDSYRTFGNHNNSPKHHTAHTTQPPPPHTLPIPFVLLAFSSAEELECSRPTTAAEWQVPATGVGTDLGTGCWGIDDIDPCDVQKAEQPNIEACSAAIFADAEDTKFVPSTIDEAVEWCKGIAKTTGRPGCCQMNHANSDFVRDDDGAKAYSEGQILYLTYYFTHTVGGTPVMEVVKNAEGDGKFGSDVDIWFVAGLISCEETRLADSKAQEALKAANETAIAQAEALAACCKGLQPNTAKCIACSNGMSLDAFCKANPESFIDECSATDAPTDAPTPAINTTVSDASSAASISASLLFAVGAVAFGACL